MENFGVSVAVSCDLEEFISIIDEFSENTNYGYSVEENNGNVNINVEVLPYFNLCFISNDGKFTMNINTCYFGLGFHILVLDLLDNLKDYFDCEFIVNDDTDYISNQDLLKLENMFDEWIKSKVLLLDTDINFKKSVFMYNENILPITDDDYFCTYRGIISFSELEDLKSDIVSLKNRIFMLPNIVEDIFLEEGYLLYHVWNNLKDLTLVDDFDERVSLTMFMFEKLIGNGVKIHLPQKFGREIYKYLGVEGFSASNFIYRKVKYEIGYENYKKLLTSYDMKFILPIGFYYNNETKTFDSDDNSIFISEYLTNFDINFNDEILEEIIVDNIKVSIFKTKNLGNNFYGYEICDDEYNYVHIGSQNNKQPENTASKIILSDKIYELVVYGKQSLEVLKQIVNV